jgi:hypothetical protein
MRVIKVEYRPEADNDLTEIFEYANGPWRASAHPCKKGFRPAHPNLEKAKDSALPKPNISSATDSRSTHPSQIQRDII